MFLRRLMTSMFVVFLTLFGFAIIIGIGMLSVYASFVKVVAFMFCAIAFLAVINALYIFIRWLFIEPYVAWRKKRGDR